MRKEAYLPGEDIARDWHCPLCKHNESGVLILVVRTNILKTTTMHDMTKMMTKFKAMRALGAGLDQVVTWQLLE